MFRRAVPYQPPFFAGNMDFHALCALGDVSGVAAALNVDPALSGALDSNLWSGLHHATKHGRTDVLEALLGARRSNLALALALALVLALIPSPIPNLDQALAPPSTLGRITIAPPCTLRLARYLPVISLSPLERTLARTSPPPRRRTERLPPRSCWRISATLRRATTRRTPRSCGHRERPELASALPLPVPA